MRCERHSPNRRSRWRKRLSSGIWPSSRGNCATSLRLMLATPPAKRNARLKYLAEKYEFYVNIDPFDRENLLNDTYPEYRKAAEEAERKILSLRSRQIPEPYIRRAVGSRRPLAHLHLQAGRCSKSRPPGRSGSSFGPDRRQDALCRDATLAWRSEDRGAAGAGRWVVRPENPLTARVWVNRLWQHHFGSGIVSTVDNLGRSGALPTHPELLDWLALQLVERGWSSKAIHRLVMTSNMLPPILQGYSGGGETRSVAMFCYRGCV